MTMLLVLNPKTDKDKIVHRGTQCFCANVSNRVPPTRKLRSARKFETKFGNLPSKIEEIDTK